MSSIVYKKIDSFASKVEEVISSVSQTFELLKNWRMEHDKLANQLKHTFAQKEYLRKKDFDSMMAVIESNLCQKEEALSRLLAEFGRQKREIAIRLRDSILNGSSPTSLSEINHEILNNHRQVEGDLARTLCSYHLEQVMLSAGMRRLIAKGEKVKINDLKNFVRMMKAFREQQPSLVAELLSDIESVAVEVAHDWKVIISTLKTTGDSSQELYFNFQNKNERG